MARSARLGIGGVTYRGKIPLSMAMLAVIVIIISKYVRTPQDKG
jgi:hypothetical protein